MISMAQWLDRINPSKGTADRRQLELPFSDIYFCRFEAGEAPLTAITRAG